MTIHAIGHEREQRGWPEALYAQLCGDVAQGALLNFAASEPKLGSPARGGLPQTEAVPNEEGTLLISGHKTWITGGDALDHLLVRLRLEARAAVAWIPATTEGVRWERTWGDGLSLRASNSNDLFLEQVTVPWSHLIEDRPGKAAPNVWFPLLVAATYLGIALAARDAVICYALERTPTALGRPIATLPKIQRQIGDIDIALKAAKQVLLATAGDWSGNPADAEAYLPQTAAAKHLSDVTIWKTTDTALQLAGAAALERGLPLERYFRDVRAAPMHPPSGDAALELIGRHALGI
jgi:alkylation response protein AidB-like acyl-CoA dehydrogenase